MQQEKKNQIELSFLQTIRCEIAPSYPYHPILQYIKFDKWIFIATKTNETILIIVINQKQIEKTYPITCLQLPKNNIITTIEFVKIQSEVQNKDSEIIYLLIGYYSGSIYYIKCTNKLGVILKKFNKINKGEMSLFNKTMNYLSFSEQVDYNKWQKTTVIKTMCHNNEISYLFRNNILVILNSFDSNIEQIEKKFDDINSQIQFKNIIKPIYVNKQNYLYFISNKLRFIQSNQGSILAFGQSVSNYTIFEQKLIITTYEGCLYIYDKSSFACLEVIQIGIAIKNINCYKQFFILCMQDDCIQLLDLSKKLYINISGHKSFTNKSVLYQNLILISSFDGNLSLTKIPIQQKWKEMKKEGQKLVTTCGYPFIKFDQYFKIGKGDAGIGTFSLINNFLIVSMLDNYIKIYKLN